MSPEKPAARIVTLEMVYARLADMNHTVMEQFVRQHNYIEDIERQNMELKEQLAQLEHKMEELLNATGQ